ncbi:MAG: phosphoenolpyruvate--protein phosphotransferase [Lachnospiraceae bacterium]|nr:phosphoenolpyruvate--protein phosphotransferase [Lachnospiraceae bacterium]
MRQFSGKTVYKGIALGPVRVLKNQDSPIRRKKISDAEAEICRVTGAKRQAKEKLQTLYDRALKEVGKVGAAIFEAHQMILEDEDYLGSICNMIQTEMVNAEYAVAVTGDNFFAMFDAMEDGYMKARAADVRDISNRLIRILEGQKDDEPFSEAPAILVADDFTPSAMIQMDRKKVLALVTVRGSANSHTAILARMMNIPALVRVPLNLEEIPDGVQMIVDGFMGSIWVEPDEETCLRAENRMKEERERARLLEQFKGKETATVDGRKIRLYANISNVTEIGHVLENDAEGIGLFRSEYLYLGRKDFPGEEEQFQTYRQAAQTMGGKKVIIRTLDVGADKQVDYFDIGKEANPAMGYRGIRICLKEQKMFRTQLRALFRAAVFGNISVMYPMITSVEEVQEIFRVIKDVQEELERDETPYRYPEQGIMIETPAAVMISDELARLVDFFSIGTNDLTQYTLAVDRQNGRLDAFYNPRHKAIFKMIRMTVENGHRHGKWVGICGELGSDPELTETFIRMGVDELSVPPSMVLKIRKKVREIKDV